MLILSGGKGSGKTTLVRDILRENGIHAQGFLSVKEVTGGKVTGISLLVLPDWRRIPVATTTPMETDVSTPRFYFYPGVFDRVNERFLDIVPGVPFVFDEYGLLEREGRGHYPVFRALIQSSHPSLIVVRSELTDDLVSVIGGPCGRQVVDIASSGQPDPRTRITAFLKGSGE